MTTSETAPLFAELIQHTLCRLSGGARPTVLARLLDMNPEQFRDAWSLLEARDMVRMEGDRCAMTPKGILSHGDLARDMYSYATDAAPEPCEFARAFSLLRQARPLDAAKLLMGQTKRHAPRSSAAAATCLDIIINTLKDFTLAGCSEDVLRHFIHTIIELADITTYFPVKTELVCPLLERARVAAQNFGDKRSVAILYLVHAHLLTFGSFNISPEADRLFDIGFEMGESIGDEDMLEYIATFLGFRHFLKGEFKEAEMQFNKVRGRFALPNSQYWWVVFHGMSSAFLGFDRQAIGSLESALQSAITRDDGLSAEFLRLHLALILIMSGKTQDALEHINAVSEQVDSDALPVLQIRTAWILMFYHYRTGNLVSSHAMMKKINDILVRFEISRPMHHFPWILEILYVFKKKGMKEARHFNLKREFELSSKSPSNQIKAGAWRIKGLMALEETVTDLDFRG